MKEIDSIAIRIEPLSNRGYKQYYRCQHFNHSSINCTLLPRCIKCAGKHIFKNCPMKNKSQPAKCCNCMGSHPANFSGCPKNRNFKFARQTCSTPPPSKSLKMTNPKGWYQSIARSFGKSPSAIFPLLTMIPTQILMPLSDFLIY